MSLRLADAFLICEFALAREGIVTSDSRVPARIIHEVNNPSQQNNLFSSNCTTSIGIGQDLFAGRLVLENVMSDEGPEEGNGQAAFAEAMVDKMVRWSGEHPTSNSQLPTSSAGMVEWSDGRMVERRSGVNFRMV